MISSATLQRVEQYMQDVLSGEVVACELVKCAIRRQQKDLERQNTDQFPYYFDARHAEAACDFFPTILQHTIGQFQGLPFELEPWQMFGMAVLFGWKRVKDDARRFRRFYDSQARKNGKSSKAAGIALKLAFADVNPLTNGLEGVAEVILCATKKEQVDTVIFAEIERIHHTCPAIKARTHLRRSPNALRARDLKNGSLIRTVGSERPYDGLNPHGIIMDELHEWREFHRKFYDTMLTGSAARTQPLIGAVTTAGSDASEIWKAEYEYAKGILKGLITDERFFAYIFEIDDDDDPLDPECWIKANPNLGVSVDVEYLEQQAAPAAHNPIDFHRFKRYHCNKIVSNVDKAFDMQAWDACEGKLSDWSGADAIGGGVDLGSRDDLAAWARCARFDTGEEKGGQPIYRYEIEAKAYIDANTQRDLTQQPFANWVHWDYLKRCELPITELRADILEADRQYQFTDVAYDNRLALQLAEELKASGITAARMAQTTTMFNEPIAEFMKAVIDGRITHNGDPVLRWCIDNAVISRSKDDLCMFDKPNSSGKIDAAVAAVMAFARAYYAPTSVTGALYL